MAIPLGVDQPDFQCTMWPDEWFGQSITDCCIAHDLGGSDLGLAWCVAGKGGPEFWLLGLAMLIGVIIGRPIYRTWKARTEMETRK